MQYYSLLSSTVGWQAVAQMMVSDCEKEIYIRVSADINYYCTADCCSVGRYSVLCTVH